MKKQRGMPSGSHSKATLKKMRLARLRYLKDHGTYVYSEASRRKMSQSQKGHSVSQEQREQISKTLKRKYRKGEIAAWNTGLQMDEELKRQFVRSKVGLEFPARRGKLNHSWKGGVSEQTNTVQRKRAGPHQKWRLAVYERDGYKCRHCGKKGERDYGVNGVALDTCHIKPWATHPKLRYRLSNGITLCRPCHMVLDKSTGAHGARQSK